MSRAEQKVKVEGSAYAELRLEGRWALSLLTEGWTDYERQALLDGDPEAKAELESELVRRIIAGPDSHETERFELMISREGKR